MYRVQYVDDEDMPEGHDFVLVRTCTDMIVFLRASQVGPALLEEVWAAFRLAANCEAEDHPPFRLRSVS